MMYNAHLEVVHSEIASVSAGSNDGSAEGRGGGKGKGTGKGKGKMKDELDGADNEEVQKDPKPSEDARSWPLIQGSRADKAAVNARVSDDLLHDVLFLG